MVPAHDEEDWLPACLDALREAILVARTVVEVVVVLDACGDRTAALVPSWVRPVSIDRRNVGAARAAGFAAARRTPGTWFATTDADTLVPVDWLGAQLASAADHDVYAGTVRVADWRMRTRGSAEAHDAAYSRRDGHPHVHGASLGISAEAYDRLGGFRALPVHEDVDLVRRAEAAGLRIHRSAAAVVTTSARVSHRAPGGFSATLDALGRTAGTRR
ncbi:glycosyltransferase family 2 protein [Mariniluteicoccus endophyticus]